MYALENEGALPPAVPSLATREHNDFQRAQDTLLIYAHLAWSLQRQKRARSIMRTWRSVHMSIASLALLIILFHGGMELFTNVLHL